MAEDAGLQVISDVTGSLLIDQRFRALALVPLAQAWEVAVGEGGNLYPFGDPIVLPANGDAALVVYLANGTTVAFDSRQQYARYLGQRSGTVGPVPTGMTTVTYTAGREYAVLMMQNPTYAVPKWRSGSGNNQTWSWTYYTFDATVVGNQVTFAQMVEDDPETFGPGPLPAARGSQAWRVSVLDVTGYAAQGTQQQGALSTPALTAPANATVNQAFMLSWTQAQRTPTGGTVTYTVNWSRTSPAASGTLAPTTDLSISTTAGYATNYTYTVTATDSLGSVTSSAKVVAVADAASVLPVPSPSVAGTLYVGTPFSVTWPAVSRTPTANGTVTYAIRYLQDGADYGSESLGTATSKTATPTSAQAGHTYGYSVQASDNGGSSGWSQYVYATVQSVLSKPVLTLPSAAVQNQTFTLSWTAATRSPTSGTVTYTVHWSGGGNSGTLPPTTNLSITDSASVLTDYTYYVTASDSAGSSQSDSKQITITDGSLSVPVLTLPATSKANTNYTISWTPAVRNPANGTVTYTVYWSGGGNSGTLPSTTGTSITDSAGSLTTYTYYVKAADNGGTVQSANKQITITS